MSLQSKSREELIHEALAGKSDEVKARVLAIVVRYKIDVRNEFFLIFVAIGHLLAIVETAPENWRKLFDAFEEKLDEWSERNLRVLAAIQQQSKETEHMSQSFLKLTDLLKQSNIKTGELQSTLISLSETFSRLNSRLDSLKGDSKLVLSTTEELSRRFNQTENQLEAVASRVDRTWSVNLGLATVVFGLCSMFGWTLWQQQGVIAEQNERLGWLLDKANRAECVNGIKPADDPQCVQYQ